ncbi:MAG: endopeptidase La, partial [Eubacteriales bacterium]|nr:endopeptidase La [Eubacteriales bacterium]
HDIKKKVKESIDQNKKDYYIREQMKVIQKELSINGEREDIVEYKKKVTELGLPQQSQEKLMKEINHLAKLGSMSQESGVISAYLDTVLDLPWNSKTPDRIDLKKAEKILEADHYGLKRVKERILEQLAVIKLTKSIKGPIICLVGPPGVGKTSVATSIARAMGRNFARISMGGVRDEAEIRGHRKTYVGAMPGRIIHAYIQAKSNNPLILLDEIDKISGDYKGDPAAALLEVLDSAQNNAFSDHYIDIPFDLSNTLFIATANTVDSIHPALYDRMEIINLSGYTDDEKINIAERHLIPNQLQNHGLKKASLTIGKGVIDDIIEHYTKEAGVRTLDREIASICRKAATRIASGSAKTVKVKSGNLHEFLGKRKFFRYMNLDTDRVGISTGLAWTAYGGDTLDIEINVLKGKGNLDLTGNLGEVMKESVTAALSYVKANADRLGVDAEVLSSSDIHLHIPEGAVPKDGPSAGITIATALVSALTGNPTSREVAMTGEITIRGRVLAIGGLKEKSMAAYRSGVKTIIIPEENVKDLDEVPQVVKDTIKFIPCSRIEQVLEIALERPVCIDNINIVECIGQKEERGVVQ